jgi:hypothetical protein
MLTFSDITELNIYDPRNGHLLLSSSPISVASAMALMTPKPRPKRTYYYVEDDKD